MPSAWMRPDRRDQLLALALGQAAGDLVEKQQLRPVASARASSSRLRSSRRQRPATVLAFASSPVRSRMSRAAIDDLGLASAAPEGGGDQQVLEHRQPLERLRDLEACGRRPSGTRAIGGARVTSRPSKPDASRVRQQDCRRSG